MNEARRRILFSQILDANLSELMAWRKRPIPDIAFQTYVEVLINSLKKDISQLATVVRYISFDDHPELYWIANLRILISSNKVRSDSVQHILQGIPKFGLWWPEALFVAAMAYESCGEFALAKTLFLESHGPLVAIGANKKAAKAMHHYETITESSPSYLPDCVDAIQSNEKLSRLENNLLRLVKERPLTKFEITERLFGVDAIYRVNDHRVEELIDAIRRKRPQLIRCESIRYAINH